MHCAYWPHGLQCEPPGSPKERPGLPNGHPGPCIKEPVSEQVLYGLWGCCGNALLETRGAPKLDPRCPNGDSGSRDACLGFPNGHLGPCIKEPVSEQVLYGLWGCRGRPLMWPSSYLQRVQMRVTPLQKCENPMLKPLESTGNPICKRFKMGCRGLRNYPRFATIAKSGMAMRWL